MFSTESGTPICKIDGGDLDSEILFIDEKTSDDPKDKRKIMRANRHVEIEDGKFQVLPNDKIRVMYVPGPSGVGKSTYTSKYAKIYKKLYPDARIILFSRIKNDPAFEGLLYKRIELNDELAANPLQLEECTEDSLVIFDDVDTISNTKLLISVLNFQSQIMELGRHKNVKCIITSHLINGNQRKQCRTIMNEMHTLTVFPQGGAVHQIRYVLDKYFGLTYKQVTKILKMDSRWVTIHKNHPQIIVTETSACFLKNF